MKHLRSTPKDRGFHDIYARLAKSINASGYFAQLVSALTEIGGLFAAALSVLYPIFGEWAIYPSAAVALIGTAVLEIGLRVVIPQAVDAVLYKRWQGLHLAMSISVFLLGLILLAASGVLSFKNSQTVVDTMVEEPEIDSIALQAAQVNYNAKVAKLGEAYRADSASTAKRYEQRIQAEKEAYSGELGSAKRELSNVYNRERRTGNSYATAKDKARQRIADVEAAQAQELAAITAERGEALAALKTEHKAAVKALEAKHGESVAEIKAAHELASTERDATVSSYGGGLAYFTIVCLFIFLSSVILDRIHHKGSGIQETVELSQYDISPPWYIEGWNALRERVQTNIRTRIAAFAEKTPAAPLPSSPNELYDPTTLANLEVRLKLDTGDDEQERVIPIQPKRRQIGFIRSDTKRDLNSTRNEQEHLPPEALPEGADMHKLQQLQLNQMKQRLKMYKKRLGSHTQKRIKAERRGEEPSERTLNAITNNEQWVQLYTHLIRERQSR